MTQELTPEQQRPEPLSRWVHFRQIMSRTETWTWLLVAVGVLFRLLEYADNRPLYMDEGLLLPNLKNLPVFDFNTTLTKDQLAAPAFLALERMMVRLPLPTIWVARLIPFLCGVASMFLMRLVARRYLLARAVPIAVGLFALDDWLVYYAAEIKQYSSDTTLTLVALLLAFRAREMNRRSRSLLPPLARLASGFRIRWFSFSGPWGHTWPPRP